jgi:hypothetical protein
MSEVEASMKGRRNVYGSRIRKQGPYRRMDKVPLHSKVNTEGSNTVMLAAMYLPKYLHKRTAHCFRLSHELTPLMLSVHSYVSCLDSGSGV